MDLNNGIYFIYNLFHIPNIFYKSNNFIGINSCHVLKRLRKLLSSSFDGILWIARFWGKTGVTGSEYDVELRLVSKISAKIWSKYALSFLSKIGFADHWLVTFSYMWKISQNLNSASQKVYIHWILSKSDVVWHLNDNMSLSD